MTETTATAPVVVFRDPKPQTLSGGRGRPSLFSEAIQAALRENPGKFAVVQTGITSKSRVSVLRAKNPGFEFVAEADEDNEGQIVIFGRFVPEAEVVAEAPSEAEAEGAETEGETPADEPEVETPVKSRRK